MVVNFIVIINEDLYLLFIRSHLIIICGDDDCGEKVVITGPVEVMEQM